MIMANMENNFCPQTDRGSKQHPDRHWSGCFNERVHDGKETSGGYLGGKRFISDMHKITDPATRHLTMISTSSHPSNTIMKTITLSLLKWYDYVMQAGKYSHHDANRHIEML